MRLVLLPVEIGEDLRIAGSKGRKVLQPFPFCNPEILQFCNFVRMTGQKQRSAAPSHFSVSRICASLLVTIQAERFDRRFTCGVVSWMTCVLFCPNVPNQGKWS